MNSTPVQQRIRRALTRSRATFRDLSANTWTIHPAERKMTPPAVYFENDLDKVTAVMEDSTYEQELSRIRGGEVQHAATVAFELKGCEILNGSLYKSFLRLPLTKEPPGWVSPNVEETFEEASLASTLYGSLYFGHWMTDDLTLQLIGEDYGVPVIAARRPYGHEPGYCELLRMKRRSVRLARFKRLVVFDDFGQNAHKGRRYETLRSRLRSEVIPQGNERVYIRRGSQGTSRTLENAPEIENYLAGQGFAILDPESVSPKTIVETLAGARVIVGLEGSHMVHSLFAMATGGTLCLLQPPYRFTNVLKNYTDRLGMTYAFVVGRQVKDGFAVDLQEFKRLLEQLERRACAANVA